MKSKNIIKKIKHHNTTFLILLDQSKIKLAKRF